VDDGSGTEFRDIFNELDRRPGVQIMRHAVNLGKGAALKTGFNYALCTYPELIGVVTADADGQHRQEDIIRIGERLTADPSVLVLGVREFDRSVPFRSRAGNVLTRMAVRFLMGEAIADTQTGLRGVPASLLPQLLLVASSGYEFELDMLITAKHHGCRVIQEPIATIYQDGNRSSHFNPLLDSMKIYFVLMRFSALSLLTAVLDNIVFFLVFLASGRVGPAQVAGRAAAVLFNYGAARRAVFLSRERHAVVLPRYLLLLVCSGIVSYGLIGFLNDRMSVPVIWAKITAESILFLANFLIQRDFVFTRSTKAATDWNKYYSSTPFTAKLTRRYTSRVIVSVLRKFAGLRDSKPLSVVEIGGANSCFLDRIVGEFSPAAYHVVDTNEYGLELLERRLHGIPTVHLHKQDVMKLSMPEAADVVMSIGLVEHFDPVGTRRAILAHFDILKPGGYAIISFPTPTLLYRTARGITEMLGLWRFPDERPLENAEVLRTVAERGDVIFEKTLWPLVFTQRFIVARKAS
jgi:putative flippase GtrA